MMSHTRLLQSSVSQRLEYNKLECFPWRIIAFDRVLIECQYFSYRKININPKYRVLMFLPCTVQVSCSTWYRESQYVQDIHDLCLLDQQARRTLFVFLLESLPQGLLLLRPPSFPLYFLIMSKKKNHFLRVVFSLYRLTVSKKIDDFLRDLVRRERRFCWFNINPLSFIHWNKAR